MIDIEALGASPNGVITQIAAMPFDISTGEYDTQFEFDTRISIQSNINCGRIMDASTVGWWLNQELDAIRAVYGNKHHKTPLPDALISLKSFVERFCINLKQVRIWSHSTYDFVMITNAYTISCGMTMPFSYKNGLDLRTLSRLYTEITGNKKASIGEFEGIKHNAIDDVIHQIKWASVMYQRLTK
jgi:hypothetical protein